MVDLRGEKKKKKRKRGQGEEAFQGNTHYTKD
jgi:hypothetical protein